MTISHNKKYFLIIIFSLVFPSVISGNQTLNVFFDKNEVNIQNKDILNFTLNVQGVSHYKTALNFQYIGEELLGKFNQIFVNTGDIDEKYPLKSTAMIVGHSTLIVNATPVNMTDLSQAYIHISVSHLKSLDLVSDVVGWVYFAAWSISFYPQTYLNWKRKSVIGLHFDFLALNTLGFLLYSLFNIGLYWIPTIIGEYFHRHPYGVNPVQLNDVIFSIHAFFACLVQVAQCLFYDRGDQKVSSTARSILGCILTGAVIVLILGISDVILWLDYLYFLSYIKLFITLIKYIPQAYYNYQRKSTSGWSIGNVLLDFTGGFLSVVQMFVLAYNYNDWSSIFGDPTKFGLGIFSIIFDIFFMVQHYVLYKNYQNYVPLSSDIEASSQSFASSNGHSNYGTTNAI